jgi:uncharacterized protein (TIGR02246 family)
MLKVLLPCLCLLCGAGLTLQSQEAKSPAPTEKKTPADATAEINELLKHYAEVFNKHDAKTLAEHWAVDAVSLDTETGERTVGREAIRQDFETLFKNSPKAQLTIRLVNHRFIRPDILSIEGETAISSPGQETDENSFTALLIKQDGKWLIEQGQESPRATPASSSGALKSLEWMVGSWVDDTKGITVESEVKWSEKKTFLVRKYTYKLDNQDEVHGGTQVIGWDPRGKTIRSWMFHSDGSFGEGTWSQSGNEWRVKVAHTLSDGKSMSGTQLITKVDANTANVQMIAQEIDGEPTPTMPAVKMVRKTDANGPKK